jgi:mono/diheme cytochrome c family protein
MRLRGRLAVLLSLLWLGMAAVSGTVAQRRTAQNSQSDANEIERGRYLVEEVAKCPECHTPRKANGELDHDAWLRGAPIWISPVPPIPNWADRAPAFGRLSKLYTTAG